MSRLALVKDIVFTLVVGKYALQLLTTFKTFGILGSALKVYAFVKIKLIAFVRSFVPGIEANVQKKIKDTVALIHKNMISHALKSIKQLPEAGTSSAALRKELIKYKELGKEVWKAGRVSGAVYSGGSIDFNNLISEAFSTFSVSNPLHPEIFPGLRQMEAEIVSMCLGLYNAPSSGCGSVTSGGTESILMTMRAHRELGKAKGIYNPEIVVPITAHAAFDKGADYFNIKLIHVPVDPVTGQVDLKKVRRAINRNTILIVGSAPGFPHGIIDPLVELSDLAIEKKVGFHIDACLGGFLIPFMDDAGFSLPFPCDFRLKGVSSISVDTHKYAFAPKGTSLILYRTKELRNYQYFVCTEWPGGVYASPSIAGSRPGSLIAACWTTLLSFGRNGYVESTEKIISAARKIRKGISEIQNLHVLGDPLLSVVAFYATSPIKTYAVADLLTQRGWHLNILQFPPSIHMACTLLTVPVVQDLLSDIKDVVEILMENPNAGNGEISAIYGTAASVPDRSIIADVSKGFLDGLTLVP